MMHDVEKVISTLEEIRTQTAEIGLDSAVIAHKFIDEILALLKKQEEKHNILLEQYDTAHKLITKLLKEQEAVEPFHKCIGKDFSLIEDSHYDYCPYCGRPITWAKQEGR